MNKPRRSCDDQECRPPRQPSRAHAALEAFADVYRAELKPFGVHFVIVEPGNMATGGPATTARALQKTAESMTAEQRALYGDAFAAFSATFNSMQSSGLDAATAAARSDRTPNNS